MRMPAFGDFKTQGTGAMNGRGVMQQALVYALPLTTIRAAPTPLSREDTSGHPSKSQPSLLVKHRRRVVHNSRGRICTLYRLKGVEENYSVHGPQYCVKDPGHPWLRPTCLRHWHRAPSCTCVTRPIRLAWEKMRPAIGGYLQGRRAMPFPIQSRGIRCCPA